MIRMTKVKHIYNNSTHIENTALNNIDLCIEDSDYVAIIGQSGSGKSTLLSVMSGLLKPTEGQVLFNNEDIYMLSPKKIAKHRNQNIGYIFQNYYLEPKFSAFENVAIPLLNQKNLSMNDVEKKVVQALNEVGLVNQMDQLASQLSGGERQRVAIARAIVTNPMVIFADEPTGNLDTTNGKIVMNLLENFNKNGKTIILVTHNENQANRASKVIRLKDGNRVDEL